MSAGGRLLATAVAVGILAAGWSAPAFGGPGAPDRLDAAVDSPAVTMTGMASITDTSSDGRLVLGRVTQTGPIVVRDIVTRRTLDTLSSATDRQYQTLSASGRFVSFSRVVRKGACSYARPWVLDRRTGRARLAATDGRGRALQQKWERPGSCAQFSSGGAAFGMDLIGGPGQMSPDGRYVAFCANLTSEQRFDLHLKDLRTARLTTRAGLCHRAGPDAGERMSVLPVHTAQRARTLMLPYATTANAFGADLLVNRRITRAGVPPGVSGAEMLWLTDDGSGAYFLAEGGTQAGRYDPATGSVTPLDAGDPLSPGAQQPGEEYRELVSMSSSGRFVAYHGSRSDPILGRVGLIGVYDRQTATAVDLSAALVTAGVPVQVADPPGAPNSLVNAQLSGNGKVLLFPTPSGWAAVLWRR